MRLELIAWVDTASYHVGWTDDPESEGLSMFYTVGWVTEENDDYLVIYSSINAKDDIYGHDTTIPWDNIVQRVPLQGENNWLM